MLQAAFWARVPDDERDIYRGIADNEIGNSSWGYTENAEWRNISRCDLNHCSVAALLC